MTSRQSGCFNLFLNPAKSAEKYFNLVPLGRQKLKFQKDTAKKGININEQQ